MLPLEVAVVAVMTLFPTKIVYAPGSAVALLSDSFIVSVILSPTTDIDTYVGLMTSGPASEVFVTGVAAKESTSFPDAS